LLEDVEALGTEDWQAMIAECNSAAPNIRFLETPVVVDNSINQMVTAIE